MTRGAHLPWQWTRRRWLRTLPAGFAGVAAAGAPTLNAAATAAAAEGSPPPPINWPALQALDGSVLGPGTWQGVPTVVVFWATYCAFCLRHNAHVDRLYRAVDPARLRVLGVALDSDPAAVRHYLRRHGYRFPVVLDGGRLRQRFTARRVIPMTCTVGSDGRLRQCVPGEMAEDDVMQLARLALAAPR